MNTNNLKILFLTLCLFGLFCFNAFVYADTPNSDLTGKIRIAILPLSVPENRTDLKQYGVGTMDTLIMALSNIPDFIMVERSQIEYVLKEQAFQQTGYVDEKTAIKMGQILGAQVLVSGNIQIAGDKIRITTHFAQVQTGEIIQTAIVTGKLEEIFDLQDDLAKRLITSQKVTVSPKRMEWVSKITKPTKNLDAYNYYLKGREEYLKETNQNRKKALEFYQKAVAADTEYALGYAGLAEAYSFLGWFSYIASLKVTQFDATTIANEKKQSDAYYSFANLNINKALKLNPNSSEVYKALGYYYHYKSISDGALGTSKKKEKEAFEKTLELNPHDSEIYVELWDLERLNIEVLADENHPYIKKALELNPDSVYAHYKLGYYYMREKKWDLAYKELQIVLKINPEHERAKFDLEEILENYKP